MRGIASRVVLRGRKVARRSVWVGVRSRFDVQARKIGKSVVRTSRAQPTAPDPAIGVEYGESRVLVLRSVRMVGPRRARAPPVCTQSRCADVVVDRATRCGMVVVVSGDKADRFGREVA